MNDFQRSRMSPRMAEEGDPHLGYYLRECRAAYFGRSGLGGLTPSTYSLQFVAPFASGVSHLS